MVFMYILQIEFYLNDSVIIYVCIQQKYFYEIYNKIF